MSDTVIHNIKVAYDESRAEVRNFANHLKNDKRREEMKIYHDEARHSPDNKINLDDEYGNEFTLICEQEHICSLKLRGM
jgi:hypothetical protein